MLTSGPAGLQTTCFSKNSLDIDTMGSGTIRDSSHPVQSAELRQILYMLEEADLHRIKGILFDKDGTILDFNSTWIPVAKVFIEELLRKYANGRENVLQEALMRSIGITDEKIAPESVFAAGTTGNVADEFYRILNIRGIACGSIEEFRENAVDMFNSIIEKGIVNPVPAGRLAEIFTALRKRGLHIGIATADTEISTRECLRKLGVESFFEFVGSDDGIYQNKPHPHILLEFCRIYGIKPEEVAVVGDTMTDMEFARRGNAGLVIGILGGAGDPDRIKANADIVCHSIQDIISDDGTLIWEKHAKG